MPISSGRGTPCVAGPTTASSRRSVTPVVKTSAEAGCSPLVGWPTGLGCLARSDSARLWIRQAITRAIADYGRVIRLPVHVGEAIAQVRRTSQQLAQQLDREPTPEEIAHALGATPPRVRRTLAVARPPRSLAEPIGEDGEQQLSDVIADEQALAPDAAAHAALLREALVQAIGRLPERERRIIRLRYLSGEKRTLESIGIELGLTRERVRQIEAAALRKLRHPALGQGLRAFLDEE